MDPPSHKKKPEAHAEKPRPSTGDLLSSAKVVADAAKASLRHEADRVDKGRVAGAAADLLDAASHYGKIEDKSLGKYAEKAEGYLREYQSSHSAHAAAGAPSSASVAPSSASVAAGHSSSASHSGGGAHSAAAAGDGGGSGGYGDYVKLAQGLLNNHSGGGGGSGAGGNHSGGGGYGDYIKMAEGFLKKR